MRWLLWLELIVLSLFMRSTKYTSDLAKMLIIFKNLLPNGFDYHGPGYSSYIFSTTPDISTLQNTISSLWASEFAGELLKSSQGKPAQT